MIERTYDIPFVASLALREKQIQQNYRPIIAVHKWFARRPGTLFRSLLLSEFVPGSLREAYFHAHNLHGKRVADPFMGGGTPLIEANRVGCDVVGYDINPMAYWIVRQEIESLDLAAYRAAGARLRAELEKQVGSFYRTTCTICGSANAHVKYFLWVKRQRCVRCGLLYDLFPGYLLAEDQRHPKNVLICSLCGELNEVDDLHAPGPCRACGVDLQLHGPATHNRCACPHCGQVNTYPIQSDGAPQHRMIAIEYYCPSCKASHRGRFFKKPDDEDLSRYDTAVIAWHMLQPAYVLDAEIPRGDETDRLHRWGYHYYHEMFNERQLLGLELSARLIVAETDERVRNALATNLSDLLRYQNMLCRYDTMALKSLDVFSVHGFPVGLVQCESNLLGVVNEDRQSSVGSGGWSNIIDKYATAKRYCEEPFEVLQEKGQRKSLVPVRGEWIGEHWNGSQGSEERSVQLNCASSTTAHLPPASLDAVLTDPPYFANVQYAELMDFCYVWLRRLAIDGNGTFSRRSTRNEDELTGNATLERGLDHFTEGLAAVFANMARALKPGAPLAFTYHHNTIEAYYPVAVAILDAGLTCSASLPCPAEMSASIHINGTSSSIIDTVFVCRSSGVVPRSMIASNGQEIARLVQQNLRDLQEGGIKPTKGDTRCVAHGHLVRMAIWNLRKGWRIDLPTAEKMRQMAAEIERLGGWAGVAQYLSEEASWGPIFELRVAREDAPGYAIGESDDIPF